MRFTVVAKARKTNEKDRIVDAVSNGFAYQRSPSQLRYVADAEPSDEWCAITRKGKITTMEIVEEEGRHH